MPTPHENLRFFALTRWLVSSSGREALRRVLPFYLALAMGAFVLFAGNGLQAATVTKAAERSIGLRGALLGAWVLATVPAARALLQDPRSQFLKTLPIPRGDILLVLGGLLALAESPWVLLWGRGGGVVAALGAGFSALALHALWVGGPRGWGARSAFALAMCLWLWAPSWGLVGGAIGIFGWALGRAWRASPDEAWASPMRWVRGPPVVALSLAHLATVRRAHAAIVVRGALLTLAAAAFAFFLVRNNSPRDFAPLAKVADALLTPVMIASLAGVAGPLLRTERAAGWTLDVAGVSVRQRRASLVLALSVIGALLGFLYACVIARSLDLDAISTLRLVGETMLLAVALAGTMEYVARKSLRDRGIDGGRLLLFASVLLIAVVSSLMVTRLAIVAWLLGAAYRLARAGGRLGQGDLAGRRRRGKETSMRLTLDNVRKSRGGRGVLDGVDLTLEGGEIVLVHGENGAGKSTLLRVVVGLLPADGGKLALGADELAREEVRFKSQLGYVPDGAEVFPELRVGEYVSLVQSFKRAHVRSVEIADGWLGRLGVDRLWRQPIATLSFGQRKRLATAAALVGDPWLLVFDEPSNGLDPDGVDLLVQLLHARAARGCAALCSTNDESFAARTACRSFALSGGRLTPRAAEVAT